MYVLIAERQKLPLALTTYAIIPITSRSGMLETVSGAFFVLATHNNKSQMDSSTEHGLDVDPTLLLSPAPSFAAMRRVFEVLFVGGWAGAVSIDSLKKRLIENKRLYTAGGGGSGGGGSGGGSGGASSPTAPTLSDHFADRWGGEKRRVRKAARYASSHISFSFFYTTNIWLG